MQIIPKPWLKSGQFAPGQSGNPGGHPENKHVRGTAAQGLLDCGWNKAKVGVVAGAEGGYFSTSARSMPLFIGTS